MGVGGWGVGRLCDSGAMSDWDAHPAPESVHGVATDGAVDAALAGIADLDGVPLAEHVARFDAVHRTLADALSAIDGN